MVTSQKYIVQALEQIAFFDKATGACEFIAVDLQEGNFTNEQEDVYALGKNGIKIGSSSRNKASRITATNGAIIDGVMAAQVGDEVNVEDVVVPFMETIPVANGKVTLSYLPVGETGNEIPFIYERNSDGTLGKKYAIGASAGLDTFAYADKEITVPTGVADGTDIVVWYDVTAKNTRHVANYDNKFSKEGRLVADIWAKGTCDGKTYYGKIIYGSCKASGNFEMAFGNDPSVQSMEFEALGNSCAGAAKLWDFVIFDGDDVVANA